MRLTLADAKREAAKRGGKCLSKKYVGCKSKLKWKCFRGHIWKSALHNLTSKGSWCPVCSSRTKLSLKTASDAAFEYGGRCLSKVYVNNRTPLSWQCKQKHKWKATLDKVKNKGQWCPKCKTHKSQGKLQRVLEELLGCKSTPNYRKFRWLVNPKTGCRLEVDIWFPSLKLAVEYDGEQHFMVKFGRSIKDLEETQYRDKVKDILMNAHKDKVMYFIRFDYSESLEREAVRSKLVSQFPALKKRIQ